MPVKFAADHLVSWEFDDMLGCMMPDFTFNFGLLSKVVDLEEGLTLLDVFTVIQSTPRLRHFVEGYFRCDLDAIASTPPDSIEDPAVVYAYRPAAAGYTLDRNIPADYLQIHQFCFVEKQNASLGYTIDLCSDLPGTLSQPLTKVAFQSIMHLPLKLDRWFTIFHNGETIDRTKLMTLLEFLEAIFITLVNGDMPDWEADEIPAVTITQSRLQTWILGCVNGDDEDAAGHVA